MNPNFIVYNLQLYIYIYKIYILFRIIEELKWVARRLSLERDFFIYFLNNLTLQRLPTSVTKQVIHFKDKINELYEVRMILTILPTR